MMFDVVTAGEALLRLSVPAGSGLESERSLAVHVAGAEANFAVALARLGHRVAWVSRLPANTLGRRVAHTLTGNGVDLSHVDWEDGGRLGTYFVELNAPPRPVSVLYDRKDSSASHLSPDDVPIDAIAESGVAYLSGITPALSESCRRAASAMAAAARESAALWCVDVNYRAKLWSPDVARSHLEPLVSGADLLICTREDAADVFDIEGAPMEVLDALEAATGAARVVVTLGADGAVWKDNDGKGAVPAVPATIVDRLGAGDAFAAGVIDGLLDGDLQRGVAQGVVLGALALGTDGDQVATSREELETLLASEGRRVDR
jgi:2-dehydro-3-deoxygluconokinase